MSYNFKKPFDIEEFDNHINKSNKKSNIGLLVITLIFILSVVLNIISPYFFVAITIIYFLMTFAYLYVIRIMLSYTKNSNTISNDRTKLVILIIDRTLQKNKIYQKYIIPLVYIAYSIGLFNIGFPIIASLWIILTFILVIFITISEIQSQRLVHDE